MRYFSLLKKISLTLFFVSLSWWHQAFAATVTTIKVPVANLYVTPNDNAAIATQGIYAAKVEVIEKHYGWSLVQTDDGYRGWIKSNNIGSLQTNASGDVVKVVNALAYVYREPDTTLHAPLVIVPFGTILPLIKIEDQRWLQVQLVEGNVGWIQQGDVNINPEPLTLQAMLHLSNNFVGLPYLWAGTSTFGFDCSGFVQFLYRQMGIVLPRDANQQVHWPRLREVARQDLKPGDILYFGWKNIISHAGVYLGDNKFVNATAYKNPRVQISDMREEHWRDIFITARRLDPNWQAVPEFQGRAVALPAAMREKMQHYTWREGCPVALDNLAYVEVSYWDFANKPQQGALVVHKKLAPEVIDIFKDLYAEKFPIDRVTPIENYQGDDERSMLADNTSAFNCRAMTDFRNKFSIHSYGAAIDINPLINPYVDGDKVEPAASAEYLDRAAYHQGKINLNSAAYRAFAKRGWIWGGLWKGRIKDYQHFEKRL